MKYLFILLLPFLFLFSCKSLNQSNDLNIKNAQISHSKFNNINNDFSYKEYKLLIVDYGKNSKFPDIK